MLIGTVFMGGVKKYKSQQIQTKFYVLGVPLLPAGDCMLVTESGYRTRKGVPLKMNNESILAAYARFYVCIFAIIALLSEHSYVSGILLGALGIYFIFFYGKSTEQENEIREVIGDFTNVYAMPEWLRNETLITLYNQLATAYEKKGGDWMAALKSGNVVNSKLAYAIALLYAAHDACEENILLKEKAAALYAAKKVSNPVPVA